MTTATIEAPPTEAMVLQWPYRMSYETYEQIVELAMIRPEEHVVLLDGMLVQTMTKGPQHHNSVDRGAEVFRAALPQGWSVRSEAPLVLRTGSEGDSAPEPDLAVVLGARDRYENRHPAAHEVGLIVEVATSPTSFAADRVGLRRYAQAGISTVWIVSLHDRTVHLFTDPTGPSLEPGYAHVEVKRPGELLEVTLRSPTPGEPPTIMGPIAVASFFPPTL